jgi:hypothetical protein
MRDRIVTSDNDRHCMRTRRAIGSSNGMLVRRDLCLAMQAGMAIVTRRGASDRFAEAGRSYRLSASREPVEWTLSPARPCRA